MALPLPYISCPDNEPPWPTLADNLPRPPRAGAALLPGVRPLLCPIWTGRPAKQHPYMSALDCGASGRHGSVLILALPLNPPTPTPPHPMHAGPGLPVPGAQGHRRVPARGGWAGWAASDTYACFCSRAQGRWKSRCRQARCDRQPCRLTSQRSCLPSPLPPHALQVPTLTDQDRFWAGDPTDWRFISARGIAEAFYITTKPGKAMMQVR